MTVFKIFVCLLSFFSLTAIASEEAKSTHGVAMHGELKYPPNFSHFDYANPNAPKGGTLKLAVVGDNKKFLVFAASELPEMTRGKGVVLQKYHDGGLSDAKLFSKKEGLTWTDRSGRTQTVDDWKYYLGKRAQAGKIAPKGFPTSKKFGA